MTPSELRAALLEGAKESEMNQLTNKENTMNHIYRHGEIMLVQVTALPSGKQEAHTSYIVGHSETGHNHVLEGRFGVLTDEEKEIYFIITGETKLVHKKATDRHEDLVIDKGIYKRFHDTEYNPFTRLIEEVRD